MYKFWEAIMLNRETTYSQARVNLANILDQVYDDRQVMVIKRQNQKNVALIAEDELSSLLESVYLLRSPENAKRLFRALAWAETTTEVPQTLVELTEELGIES
jgi:antitoxin YefM